MTTPTPALPDPERWRRLNELFHAAIGRAAPERAAFLEEACAGDAELRAKVERLVAAHERAEGFIGRPPLTEAVEALHADEPSAVGRQLGPYRILREIGRGGMGAVYLAERADRQYEKRVAVKLMKRGMDTDALLRQFRHERQILARLDHPNIARLLDGGTTDDGLPYFVMEFVDGAPIDRYCRDRALPLAARLGLFRQVCAAVSYAHQHLVVHRDIKPSNVLVTTGGAPKLLDFGIARIVRGDGSEPTLATQAGLGLATPEYASPEQLQGRPATTQSDVYSLGVVLYELLSGQRPYRFPSRDPLEVVQAIAGTEPLRPSEAVTPAAAAAGGAEGSQRLRRRLRGDLDNIVLMAIRREPERRYPSVERLSEDVARHLEGRPVVARRDTLLYRWGKFARRNRAAVAAAVLVFLSLVGGIVATRWQARRAQAQEAIARAEQGKAERRFDDIRKLTRSLLFDYHDAIKDLPGATPVRARLVRDALSHLDALAREAADDPALENELAAAYERVGDVQGGSTAANLGDSRGATESYRKALALRQAALAAGERSREARRAIAVCHRKLGTLIWETGDMAGALDSVRSGLSLIEALAVEDPADGEAAFERVSALTMAGRILQEQGDDAGARGHFEKARSACEALLAREPGDQKLRRSLSVVVEQEGIAFLNAGELPKALETNRRALELRAALAAEFPLNADYRRTLGISHYNQAEILEKLQGPRAALDSYRRSLAIAEDLLAADPKNEQFRSDVAYALVRVGDVQAALDEFEPALAGYRRSLRLRAQDVEADPGNLWKRSALVEAHARLAKTLARAGQGGASLAAAERARTLLEGTPVEPTNQMYRSFLAATYGDLGEAHATLASAAATPAPERDERWRSARDLHRRGLEVWQDLRARGILADIDAGRPEQAARAVARCERMLARGRPQR